MEEDSPKAQFPYPLNHCKILHLVRHGQAMHNVEGDKDREALLSPHLFDAQLSPQGCVQVEELRKYVRNSGLLNRTELVVVSPLLRTMQTALRAFGSQHEQVPGFAILSKEEKTKNDVDGPMIMGVELARDKLGVRPCDMRRTVTEYQSVFPSLDFSMMDGEEDNLWTPDVRESDEDVQARGRKLMKWLWTRPEKEIVIVSHGVVLQHILNVLGNDSDPSVRTALCKRFSHCEIRSVVIVDKRNQL